MCKVVTIWYVAGHSHSITFPQWCVISWAICKIFQLVWLPPELRSLGQGGPSVHFLGSFTQYILHNLFIFMFWDGLHLQQRCSQRGFNIGDIYTQQEVIFSLILEYLGWTSIPKEVLLIVDKCTTSLTHTFAPGMQLHMQYTLIFYWICCKVISVDLRILKALWRTHRDAPL